MKMICLSAFEFFDIIYRVHIHRQQKNRHKILWFHYFYQSFIIFMMIHNIFIIWCFKNNFYKNEIIRYDYVIYEIFYEFSGEKIIFISSTTIHMIFILYLNHFTVMNIAQIPRAHLDDCYDVLTFVALPLEDILYYAPKIKLLQSYEYLNQRCIKDLLTKLFWMNFFSKHTTQIEGKIMIFCNKISILKYIFQLSFSYYHLYHFIIHL